MGDKANGETGWREKTDLCVRITQLDRDVPDKFVFETDSHDTRNGLDHGRFAVSDMADRS